MLLLAILAGLAQYALVRATQDYVAALQVRLIPQGELRYERLWPFLWGGARVWGLSFQPEGLLRLSLQLPEGFRTDVGELRIEHLALDAGGRIEQLSGRLVDVSLPLDGIRSAPPPPTDPLLQLKPNLADLGYNELRFDADFELRYIAEADLALLRVEARSAGLGRLQLRAQLEGSPPVFARAQDQIRVRRIDVDFHDDGLLRGYKALAAQRAQLSERDWARAVIDGLKRRAAAERWSWDARNLAALGQAIRHPAHVRAGIRPPGEVFLRNLRLYRVADWPRLLGFAIADDVDDAALAASPAP